MRILLRTLYLLHLHSVESGVYFAMAYFVLKSPSGFCLFPSLNDLEFSYSNLNAKAVKSNALKPLGTNKLFVIIPKERSLINCLNKTYGF